VAAEMRAAGIMGGVLPESRGGRKGTIWWREVLL
jgi:hypothetical protein